MQDHSVSRSMALFEEGIKSKYTRMNYASHLKNFEKFSGLKSTDIPHVSRDILQKLLEDYLIELKHTANPNSIPSKFQGIRHFCIMNRIIINWDVIRKMFPQKRKTSCLRAYTNDEIRIMLQNTKCLRDKALIHFLASTGARIGVFDHHLVIQHMQKMPQSCMAIKLYAGEVEEYWSFLTPQASRTLRLYFVQRKKMGEVLTKDTPIFVSRGNTKQLGWSGSRSAIYRIVSKSNILRHKQNHRYDVQVDHGFRKRFNTILKLNNLVNYNIAEKLMGHKNGLDGIYFTPTLEELFKEFKKIMHGMEIYR